ncbi:MAG: MarR family transcriptional regulator [Candidatus Thorarchaeota archaeon]|nr:MAG: MarR family transcriptional regulator [Candidatus Thorarchaeota archaeon]
MSMVIPESALIVLDTLVSHGPMAPKDISKKANLPLRTVSFALRRLTRWELCRKIPNLRDMRRPLYHADQEKMRAAFMKYGQKIA